MLSASKLGGSVGRALPELSAQLQLKSIGEAKRMEVRSLEEHDTRRNIHFLSLSVFSEFFILNLYYLIIEIIKKIIVRDWIKTVG